MCRMKSFLQILEKSVKNENRDFYNLSLGISNLTNSLFVRVVELANVNFGEILIVDWSDGM